MAEFPPTRASLLVRLGDSDDGDAWRQFVALYAPLVYAYARKHHLQDADAADLCQEVLRAVATSIGRLEYDPARGAFRSWLFTIVRRKLATWRSASANRSCGSGDTAMQEALKQCPAPDDREAEWERDWQRRLFAWPCDKVRGETSEVTWQAFWKTAVEGQTGKQVGAELGLTVAAVYHARSRVLARLKECVASAQEP